VENVRAVQADAVRHSVSVDFDDEKVSLRQIVEALNDAGYTVGEPKQTN